MPLDDGRLLIVGGWDGLEALSTAELYDPVSEKFSTATRTMTVGRIDPSVTRLPDGRVLIAGGHDGFAAVGAAEVYDPFTDTFEASISPELDELASASARHVSVARTGHQVTVLGDGRMLITGGRDENQALVTEALIYNPTEGTFSSTGYLLTARADHRAVRLPDGHVLVLGGTGADGVVLDSAELYDPVTGRFVPAPSMREARSEPIVTVLEDGQFFVTGGVGAAGQPLATAEICRCAAPAGPRLQTSTVVRSDVSSSTYGQPVTYTAAVTSADGAPWGAVQFLDGGALLLGTTWLDQNGRAQLTVSNTPAGTRSITAVYSGFATFEDSQSLPIW